MRLRKDMNNSIYGKTCENLTKRTDIQLVTTQEKCSKLINKPHCKRFQIFAPNLAAVELQKVKCLINKPSYVGFSVLELSKLHMYKFHYDCIRKWYPSADLLFTDTDSLVYEIYTDDLYADLASHGEHFDFSGYSIDHPLYSEENKMVMGKMKDESGGDIITEFVGLRPKMYSYTTQQFTPNGVTIKEAKRAKGIQRAALTSLAHMDYLKQLRNPNENYVNIVRIGQKHHRIYTIASKKRGLCAFDDKRYLLSDGIHTLAHGHHRTRELQQQQEEEEQHTQERMSSLATVDEENVLYLSTVEAQTRNLCTITNREALSSLDGVNLREVLDRTSSTQKFQTVDDVGPASKRSRTCVNDCSDDEDEDEMLTIIKRAAYYTVPSDMF